jgi:N-carbamoylputrescine amidase
MSIEEPLHKADGFPDMTVACVQLEPEMAQKARNLHRTVQCIEQAAGAGAKIIVLPELVNTGYAFRSREEAFVLAEETRAAKARRRGSKRPRG